MAGLRGDLSTSFSDSSSLTSSPSSSYSFSEASQTDLTSGSEGDLQAPVDEGIYGWILSLIEEEKIARFVDRCQGIYELDWQIVVSKYWFEWRRARRQSKSGSKNVKNVKFSHRTASNTLRGSLLNAYKEKGAKEFHEKKVLNSGNKTIKRWFKLPTTMAHKLSKCQHKASDPTATADTPKTIWHSFLSSQQDLQKEGAAFAIPSAKPISSTNFDFVEVDDKESDILLPHLFDHQQMASQTDQAGTSETPDHNCTKVESCAGSSGYDSPCGTSSSLENPVQEIDPREGPFKGGNTAFIFLEKAMYSRSHNKSACKVLFSVPKHGPMSSSAVEVTATLKNCFTVKVCVPRCPGLSREQLTCGKVTAHVLVKTSEGRYIGETRYTYNVDFVAQLRQCVRALDDEDMELEFTGTTDEQHVALNYRLSEWESTGSHLFNLVSLRMLVFMAVKEKACNFLAAFLYSPAAPPVLQHYSEKLLSFLEYMRKSEQLAGDSSSLLVLDMCEKMLQKNTFQNKSVEKAESVTLLQANESRQSKEEYRKGYNSSSELETDQEMESLTLQTLIETKTLESKVPGQKCDRKEITLEGKRRNVAEENDQGEVTSVQLSCSLNVESAVGSQETKLLAEWSSNKPKIYVLRKPGSPVPISRSRSSFPDPRTDVFVELQVRRMQRILEHTREASEHVLNVTEHVPVNKDQVIVDVRHSGTDQAAKDWESKYVKRVCGKIGYWFRFYKPNCELLLVFSLCDRAVPQLAVKPETKLKTQVLRVLDQATVIVETINWKGPFSKESTAVKLEFSISRPVPLVSLSRSQTSLCEIMKWLHKFCDNGLWAEFERACKNLQRQFCSADIKVAILLEKAIAFLYQHDLEKAELTALAALDKSSQAENHRLLAGRAYYYLAHVYRRERKLGEAVRCIDLSKQNLHLLDVCLDQSFMAYEEGNVMKEFISSVAVLSKKLVIEAKMCFERCLDLCKRLDDSDGSVVPTTHSFALIKIAMLLLDCGSTSGRDRCVSASYINEAKRFLDTFQRRGLDDITERRKIQFYLALSDLQYRLGNYHTALHDAEGALEKAKELGFLLEVVPARNRLCHISQRLES